MSNKETIKLSDMAQKIYDITKGKITLDNVKDQFYLWFIHNEAERHLEDVSCIKKDISKLNYIINDPNRKFIDRQIAIAMRQFLSEELKRHEDELANINKRMLDFSLVSSIPAIRVEVE